MTAAGTVRAAVQTGPRRIELRSFPRPRTGPDDGLLRLEACGICGSDVEGYKGALGAPSGPAPLPMVPGHELLGIVEEVGERAAARWNVRPGDRVAVEHLITCRACGHCLTGNYLACRRRPGVYGYTPVSREPALWGGYAEYAYLHPNVVLHRVRKDLPAEVAVMFNALGAGVRWTCQLGGTRLGDTVLILGPGQRGLMALLAAKAAGAATVIVTGLGRDAGKLALARELGADHTIDVDREDTIERVREITGGALADVVLELTPMATQPVVDALEAVRHGGRVVLGGLKGQRTVALRTDVIINKAITVVGAFSVDAPAYSQAIRLIESGRFPLEKLHTHSFGLDEVALAIETLAGEVPGEDAVHVAIRPNGAA